MNRRGLKLGAGFAVGLVILLTAQGCIFGGGDDNNSPGGFTRPGSIPTATLPATMTDPILLGESQAATGAGTTGTGGGASGQTYTVESGDTLGAIATSLGVSQDQQAAWIAEVLRLNGIADARQIGAGQELTLPRMPTPTPTVRPAGTPGTPAAGATGTPSQNATPGATSAAATPTATERPSTTGSGRTYTVESGDTPLVIAGKLDVPEAQQAAWANELVTLNDINPSNMQIGDVLELPVSTP